MKRIAVISCGASAHLFPGPERYNAVIGARDVVERWPCDWWALCDVGPLIEIAPIGRPNLFLKDHIPRKLPAEHAERLAREVVLLHSQISLPAFALPPNCEAWNAYSGLAALGLAYHLGANVVDVYGADMDGERDWRGKVGASRHDQRWAYERSIWQAMSEALQRAGMAVNRVLTPREVASCR